jgi:hypothetical protein
VKLGAPERAGAFDDLTTALALAVKVMMAPPETKQIVSLHDELATLMDDREWEALAASYGGPIDPRY